MSTATPQTPTRTTHHTSTPPRRTRTNPRISHTNPQPTRNETQGANETHGSHLGARAAHAAAAARRRSPGDHPAGAAAGGVASPPAAGAVVGAARGVFELIMCLIKSARSVSPASLASGRGDRASTPAADRRNACLTRSSRLRRRRGRAGGGLRRRRSQKYPSTRTFLSPPQHILCHRVLSCAWRCCDAAGAC